MSIKDFIKKIKSFLFKTKDYLYNEDNGLKIKNDFFIVILIFLVGIASFGLGKISSFEKKKVPISILNKQKDTYTSVIESSEKITINNEQSNQKGIVIASKTGKKYYYPWCSGTNRIKEDNKIWFNSIEEARARGLTPASGCIGLK